MKTTEIAGDTVTYFFKDADGQTVSGVLTTDDKKCIERALDKGDTQGKLIIQADVTLFWDVEF